MKNLKKAFEEFYRGKEPIDALDHIVLLRIERYKRKKILRLMVLESLAIFLLLSLHIYNYFKPKEYTTMGVEGVQVKLVKDVSFLKLSKDLELAGLRIEGPYEDKVFLIKGEEKRAKDFIKKSDCFKLMLQ
ncbi:MAG: hypothetical protein ABWK04_03440 [Hydrogenobacter sp.]|mgnify:CR=1 FL=1|uniref:hypothetical protein n=1 Tax=Hydrogenobacter thermophilus TaxID=940 RepID=UPI0030F61C26